MRRFHLVGAAGLEPARPERTLDFKSKASANSAMPPYPFSIAKGMKKVNWEIAIRGANGLPRLTQYS